MTALQAQPNAQANAYLRTRVMTASPEELRLMLLEGAIKFARKGCEAVAAQRHEEAFTNLSSAREIILELLTTIRDEPNPELAANVRSLYTFLYTHLVEGSFERDTTKITKVAELLEYERETWVMLMQKLAEERAQTAKPVEGGVSVQG
ncbi:MAG TPA: flagellar export chaperone FliS [Phycisphaerales bacterium]|nr:flagellar export chaperone FliS [Phycisphaerales bacterium]